MADPEFYRRKEETERWKELDPIVSFRKRLQKRKVIDDEAFQALEQDIEEVVNEAVRFAEESPKPPPEALYQFVYREES
jgi:pyruvate dehydrogenase E1 component alpha subunit